jgi:hypothetical protein
LIRIAGTIGRRLRYPSLNSGPQRNLGLLTGGLAQATLEVRLHEQAVRHDAERHVKSKEVEMLRSQLASSQQAVKAAKVGG